MTPKLLACSLLASASALAFASSAVGADAVDSGDGIRPLVVTAPRQESVAREVQRDAPNIVNVQSAETIQKYPDFNAAEALGRIPGISISTDTGEGRFVNIRGIDGNLVGATFGGVPLLNTNPGGTYFGGGGRAVEYDTIPVGSVDGIIVTKTTVPDHEAEGLGGSVELTPRTANHVSGPFFEGAIGWGFENERSRTGPFNLEGAFGDKFGPLSFVVTASTRQDRRGFDDIEEDYIDPTSTRAYDDLQLRHYDYHRRRFGYGGEVDYQPDENHGWYARANVAGYTESAHKNFLVYNDLGDGTLPNGQSVTTNVRLSSTDEQETHRNQVYVIGGHDQFGPAQLDYRVSYSRATFRVGQNFGARFKGPQGLPFTYDNSGNDGDTPSIHVDNTVINNPANYSPATSINNSTEDDTDSEWAYAANLQFPVHLLGDQDRIKVGAQARLRTKESTPYRFTSKIAPLSLANVSGVGDTDFYDGRYTNGPMIDLVGVRKAYEAGVVTGGVDQGGVFTAKENVYAAYGQYQATIGKWGLLAGVRVERTEAKYGAYSDDNPTQDLVFVTRSADYTNAFPTVQVRYNFSDDLIVRATYSTGVGRPGFLQNTASTSSNHDPGDPQISQGNPNLKPTTGSEFDIDVEYYLPHGGIVQLGAFDNEFDNYIVPVVRHNVPYAGSDPAFQGLNVTLTTFGNRGGAYARGVEAAYHQTFDWLPGPWAGLGFDGNITLVDSHILEYDAATSASGVNETGLLPGTSRVTFNVAPFYERNGIQARLAGEYVSKELFGLGGTKSADVIQDSRFTLDFTSSYAVTPNWTAFFNVKNLSNAPLRFYVFDKSFPIQREFYQQTFEFGLRAKF